MDQSEVLDALWSTFGTPKRLFLHTLLGQAVGPVTEGDPSRALEGLEGDDQGRRLWYTSQ